MIAVNTELIHLIVTIVTAVGVPIFIFVIKSIVSEGNRKTEKLFASFTLELEKRLGKYEVERVKHITESETQHVNHNRRLTFLEQAYEKINTKMDTQKDLLNKLSAIGKATRAHQESHASTPGGD